MRTLIASLAVVLGLMCAPRVQAQLQVHGADSEKGMVGNGAWELALKAADLSDILANSGPFTVFAPTERALEDYLESRAAVLLDPDNKQKLRSLVSYHMVAGRITASQILRQLCRGNGVARFTTVQGEELLATIEGTDIVLTDCSGNRARILQADGLGDNVVYHEIDSVIQPLPNP
ncbi:fasciclin domain-containing protein [Robiginitalea sediminis]|uniref:fasciclin domain-containing protein n=1 Tax=Robiginitalea sediminis TaxID=1982593 RepID=UPI0013034575|nr:fasciclin domain-containing protein [Robiginitalea sediminis]